MGPSMSIHSQIKSDFPSSAQRVSRESLRPSLRDHRWSLLGEPVE